MKKPSSGDNAFIICLVSPKGYPIRSPHDVIVSDPNTKKTLYRGTTDGAGKLIVPHFKVRKKSQVVLVEIRNSSAGGIVSTRRLLYEKKSACHREQIYLPPTKEPIEKILVKRPKRVNRITYQWRQSIRRRLEKYSGKSGRISVPKAVNAAIYDLNNAYRLAQQIFSGDFNAAQAFLKLTGQRHHRSAFFSAGAGLGANNFSLHDIPGLPCVFQDGGALDVAYAGLLLDLHRAEVLGDLTQPGAYTEQSARFLHDRSHSLQVFAGAVVDLSEGRISEEAYRDRVFGDGNGAVPLPDEIETFP